MSILIYLLQPLFAGQLMLSEEQINEIPHKTTPAIFLVLIAALGSFSFGYSLGSFNTTMKFVVQVMEWCSDNRFDCEESKAKKSLVSSIIFVGCAVGATLCGSLLKYGRRRVMFIMNLLFVIGPITVALVPASNSGGSLFLFSIARFISGLGVGLSTVVVPLYISEMAPVKIRGALGCLHQTMINVGLVVSIAVGLPQHQPEPHSAIAPGNFESNYWRWVACMGIVVVVIQVFSLLFIFKEEPATFSISKMKTIEQIDNPLDACRLSAFKSLCYTYEEYNAKILFEHLLETQRKSLDMSQMTSSIECPNKNTGDFEPLIGKSRVDPSFDALHLRKENDLIPQKRGSTTLVREISVERLKDSNAESTELNIIQCWRDPQHRKPLLVGCMLAILQQSSCINVVVTKSNSILEEANVSPDMITVYSLLTQLVNFGVTLSASRFVDKVGRKTMLLVGLVAQSIALAPAAIGYLVLPSSHEALSTLAIISMIGYIAAFAVALGPILWVYVSEIWTESTKDSSMGFVSSFCWVCSILIIFSAEFLSTGQVYNVAFWSSIIGIGMVQLFLIETAGRSYSPFYSTKTGIQIEN